MRRRKRFPLAAIAGAACCLLGGSLTLRADEWETNTPYYEDDAWYDVSEWFDGNDYNPTDESAGVWDNETYNLSSETGVDGDNDWGNSLYGDSDYDYDYDGNSEAYDAYAGEYDDGYRYDSDGNTETYDAYYGDEYEYDYNYDYDGNSETYDAYVGDYSDDMYGYDGLYDDDDWFYDYYDDGYSYYTDFDNNGLYDYNYRYFDFDNDSYYDAYSVYTDWDNDGLFDDYDYYSLNDVGSTDENERKAKDQSSKEGKEQRISGEVVQVKKVSVKDTKNCLVQIEKDGGQTLYVDLGPASNLNDFDISEGDQISVRGPVTKVGDKKLLIAQQLQANNNSTTIDRNRRKFTGQVDGIRTVNSRGQQHSILLLSTDAGKRQVVDLGPANKLDADLNQGDKVTVRGPLTKVNDRKVVLAQTLTHDGDQSKIDRRQRQSEDDNRQASRN